MKRLLVWTFVFIALITGVFLGLRIKSFAKEQLLSLLETEIKASTPCHLETESVDISFLTLSAMANNVAMVCNSKQKMLVKTITASFSLRDLWKRQILLDLGLHNGFVDGFGPESEAFRFIYYLAEPIPPEKDRPDRWRVKLMNMDVSGVSVRENLGNYSLIGEGGSLEFKKDNRDFITLIPSFANFYAKVEQEGNAGRVIEIGNISARIISEDTRTNIEKLDLAYKDLWLRLKGIYTDATNEITASANYKLSSSYLQLPNWLQCPLHGGSELSGSIDNPSLKGELSCPLTISVTGLQEQHFSDFKLVYELSPMRPKSVLSVKSVRASNETINADIKETLKLVGHDLSGSMDIEIKSLKFEDNEFNDLKISLSLDGNLDRPRVNYTAQLDRFKNSESFMISDLHSSGTAQDGAVAFSLYQESPQGKVLSGSGEIKLFEAAGPKLHNSKLFLTKYPLPLENPKAFVDAELDLSGPLSIEEITISGRGKVLVSHPQSEGAIELILGINKGKADLSFSNTDKKFVGALKISDLDSNARGDLDLKIAEQGLNSLVSTKACLDVGGELSYVFNLSAPLYGDGKINLYKLSAGCEKNVLKAEMPLALAIKKGDVSVANVKIDSNQATLRVGGKVSLNEGFDIEANGSLNLDTLLPLAPSLDDLGGNVDLRISVIGPLQDPELHGDAVLKSGRFSIASEGINASMIDGNLILEGDRIAVNKLHGELNSGDFDIDGYVVPVDLKRSAVNLHFDKIVLEPVEDLLLIVSGSLDAGIKDSGRPLLEGVLNIDSAQYQKNIDIRGLLGLLTSTIFGKKEAFQATAKKFTDLDLKLQVNARRNIYVFTNWFGAELRTDLSVEGPISAPNLTGGFSSISGWLGFRNRRFIITSGSVNFNPPSTEPYLDLVAETKLYSSIGNPVSVVLEAKGLLRQPTIEFSSDQGLAQQDIFTLLATGQGASNATVVDSVGRDLEKGSGLAISSVIPFLPLPGFFDDLTRIDNFYFEPELDPATGLVEPVAIATKNLGDQFIAVGKMGLGERRSVSRASIIYDLTPRLNIAGIFEAGNPEENASLGVDLSYTVFSRLGRAVKIKFEGNDRLSDADLMKKLSLNESVSIQKDDIPEIISRIKDVYIKAGFRAAEVGITCDGGASYCTTVKIDIREGPMSMVETIDFRGDNLDSVLGDNMPKFGTGVVASSDLVEEVREKLVKALRKEGYIAARIDVHYENDISIDKVKLVIRSVVGKPVTFQFQGNNAFKAKEFLDTINIFTRRIPFGTNTVNLLIENMGLLYRRSGYLYASISKQESLSEDGSRLIFTITIDEGKKVYVSEVSVEGNSDLLLDEIETAFLDAGEVYYHDMFHPDFAVPENIGEHADFLSNYYIREGYPEVKVESRIESTEDEDKVRIRYVIQEGKSNRGDWVIVEGIPDEVDEPESPKAPYSLTKANDYLREIFNALRKAAYFNPIINSTSISDGTQLKFLVIPGEKSTVDKIVFEGNVVVSEETLRKSLSIKEGNAWEAKNIQASRLKLLKTGLFSNVDIYEEKNGSNTRKILRIVVKEKPLQTLQLGGGLNSEYGLHVFGEGSDLGLFKDGRSLSLRMDAYYDSVKTDVGRSAVNLRYLDPTFAGSNVSFTEDLRYVKQSLANQEFDLDRMSLTTAFYDTLRSGLTFSAGHTIFEEKLNDVSPDAILSPLDYGVLNISSLAATLRYDRRDSALIPTRGFFASLDAGLASEMIASDANYYSLNGKFSYLIPLHLFDRRFVISLASRLASAWTFDGTPEIPISQRFYAGGRTSVRGFSENSLGPRGLNGSVIGGDTLTVNNIQFNYLMNDSIACHSFFDFGNIFLREREIDMTDLRKGTGVGVEYLSPVGPIGIDIGFPLQRRAGESSYRIYFTVGTLF